MKRIKHVLIGGAILSMSACGGGTPGGNTSDVTLSGVVTAPSGAIAQLQPTGIKSMLADALFGRQIAAVTTGWSDVGGGVAVQLIQVDAAGSQVGEAIATATTASDGSYSLTLPDGFTGGPEYVVRVGSGTVMDSRVPVSSGSLDINPGSDAASDLVTDVIAAVSGQLSDMSIDELQTLMDETESALVDIDFSAYTDISGFSAAILDSVKNDEEKANVLYSSVSSGKICGTVTDSNGAALQNILVLVRDYGNWVTRAKAKTDASGNYCLNVPKAGDTDPFTGNTVTGEYILGAINRTGASYAASEWWTSGGGSNNQFGAEKISVPNSTQVDKDFSLLASGARITGTVQGFDGVYAQGMKVLFREYDTFKPVVSAPVQADGSYRVNVAPGDYLISFRNNTKFHHYASEVYNNQHQRNQGDRVTVVAGANGPYDANLEAGKVFNGTVYTNSTDSVPAVGTVVTLNDPSLSGSVERIRTNKKGKFRMWVQTGVDYEINARGSTQAIAAASSAAGLAFATDVAEISGKLVSDADGTTPVSQLFVRISPWNGTQATQYISQDSGAEDGSFTLYAPPGDYIVYARADSDINYGSGVYNGTNMANSAYGDVAPITVGVGEVGSSGTGHPSLGSNIRVPTLGVTSSGTLNTGVGYLDGSATAGATSVKILTGTSSDKRLTTTASRGDGSFRVSLPAGTYSVKSLNALCNSNVVIADGMTTTVTFSDSTTCSSGSPH